jgi:filamin
MASQNNEEGDEDLAAERELGDDAMWKVIQKNTFTRWTNEQLKVSKLVVVNLEKDLADGLKLIALIEALSGKKFQKYNKKPNFRTQKFENVTMSLKFLEETEGIKIVNIDSSDIVDQKLKLIMGLIWTLILHYSITMPTWEDDAGINKDLTPKQRLLAWIQNKIPEKNITNFTSDWNDGTAIAALVDALLGLCLDWPNMDPKK